MSGSLAGRILLSTAATAALVLPHSLPAQQVRRGAPPLDLPRPGFERHVSHVGPLEVRLEADVSTLYDTNVYATSTKPQDDMIAVIRPRVEVDWPGATTSVHGEAYAEIREHFDLGSESSAEFGGAIDSSMRFGQQHVLSSEMRYDRAIQSRADPEARVPITEPPRKIDIVTANVNYTFTTSNLALTIEPAYDGYNYLDPSERDRDMKSYRVRARATWKPAAPVAFFLEGYGNWRNFDLAKDFSGIDRDANTYGVLVGASREISGRIRGQIGFGVFRFNPDDPTLSGYTGFAVNGSVTWSPQARTALTFSAFRGDVATVRAGASGRTDTRVGLRVDQEARHNLLLNAGVSWVQSDYRGSGDRFDTLIGEVGAEYLIDRAFSLFTTASYARRKATDPLDEYSRGRIELGIRARY